MAFDKSWKSRALLKKLLLRLCTGRRINFGRELLPLPSKGGVWGKDICGMFCLIWLEDEPRDIYNIKNWGFPFTEKFLGDSEFHSPETSCLRSSLVEMLLQWLRIFWMQPVSNCTVPCNVNWTCGYGKQCLQYIQRWTRTGCSTFAAFFWLIKPSIP